MQILGSRCLLIVVIYKLGVALLGLTLVNLFNGSKLFHQLYVRVGKQYIRQVDAYIHLVPSITFPPTCSVDYIERPHTLGHISIHSTIRACYYVEHYIGVIAALAFLPKMATITKTSHFQNKLCPVELCQPSGQLVYLLVYWRVSDNVNLPERTKKHYRCSTHIVVIPPAFLWSVNTGRNFRHSDTAINFVIKNNVLKKTFVVSQVKRPHTSVHVSVKSITRIWSIAMVLCSSCLLYILPPERTNKRNDHFFISTNRNPYQRIVLNEYYQL